MIDEGGASGLLGRYRGKVEQERGIPVWVRIGLDGGLLLVGYIDPHEFRGYHPAVALGVFFEALGKVVKEQRHDQPV